ncbi:hypothetical protein GCM10011331_24050 [Flavimobilis marinus]|uniref:Uncharacterized protein n=2 Tax=Flavimobilis marinus TaxID=285351 RepID=A0A1I2GJ75_9MICO|nr:hypothetical protein GCM10011331_24050 [Flavimobilis marinus]SFF16897.1 hypothetical protein SAMN04488035_1765 [Flavimobilis marinus]
MGVLALAGLWGMYLVPHGLKHRSQLLQSRTDDRFSGSLRVLAVAADSQRRQVEAPRAIGPARAVPLLTAPMATVTSTEMEGARTMDQPAAPRPATSSARPAPSATPSASIAERRAAAARRRLVLTLTLLGLAAIAWSAVPAFSLSLIVPGVVTALLGAVLVLGRRAAISAQRDQAEQRAARRAPSARTTAPASAGERPTSSARVVRGAPGARVAAGHAHRITGHAVHASQTNTRMISSDEVRRQMAAEAEADRANGVIVDGDVAAMTEQVRASVPTPVVGEGEAAADASGVVEKPAVEPSIEKSAGQKVGAEKAAVASPGGELAGFSLPRPTYTMKPAAPRREVAPLEDADVTTPMTARSAETTAPVDEQAAEASTSTEGLGLNLNQILARRRASGQ